MGGSAMPMKVHDFRPRRVVHLSHPCCSRFALSKHHAVDAADHVAYLDIIRSGHIDVKSLHFQHGAAILQEQPHGACVKAHHEGCSATFAISIGIAAVAGDSISDSSDSSDSSTIVATVYIVATVAVESRRVLEEL